MAQETAPSGASQVITLEAILMKISTTVDGGWNITFSADQSQVDSIMLLSALRDEPLQFAIVPFKSE
jgi:hypothetical protein